MKNIIETSTIFISTSSYALEEAIINWDEGLTELNEGRAEVFSVEENISSQRIALNLETFLNKNIDKPELIYFYGHGFFSAHGIKNYISTRPIILNSHNSHPSETENGITLEQIETLLLASVNRDICFILDCCFSGVLNKDDRNYVKDTVRKLKVPACLISTSAQSLYAEKDEFVTSSVLSNNSNVYQIYANEYLKNLSLITNRQRGIDNIGISVLEGLSLHEIEHESLASEYYALSIQNNLLERQADRIEEILTLAEKNNSFSELIARIDKLICQKLGIPTSQEHDEAQIAKFISWIKSTINNSYLLGKEDKFVKVRSMLELDFKQSSKQVESMNFTSKGKLDIQALLEISIPEKKLLFETDFQTNRRLSKKLKKITCNSVISIESEYYCLSEKPELLEEEAARISEILELAEKDNQLSKCIEKIDEQICQKIGLDASDEVCKTQSEKALEIIEKTRFYKTKTNLDQLYTALPSTSDVVPNSNEYKPQKLRGLLSSIQINNEVLMSEQHEVNPLLTQTMSKSTTIAVGNKKEYKQENKNLHGNKVSAVNLPSIMVLGIPVTAIRFTDQCNTLISWAKQRHSKVVCVADVHMLIEARRNLTLRTALERADMVAPDDMPLVWVMKAMGMVEPDPVAGMDIFVEACKHCVEENISIYLLGSTEDVLHKMQSKIERDFPGLKIAGVTSPPFRPPTLAEDKELVKSINDSGAGFTFVSLGCPKQECWMYGHQGQINSVMVGLGRVFPVYAGIQKRAPQWVRKYGLEWAYRLRQEPNRLFRRYFTTIPPFILFALIQILNKVLHPQAACFRKATIAMNSIKQKTSF
jgi:N-acetylglucosaminyldiphosphoundecaprenol N-acetyl-beta-D-mannosaminyltransferase